MASDIPQLEGDLLVGMPPQSFDEEVHSDGDFVVLRENPICVPAYDRCLADAEVTYDEDLKVRGEKITVRRP